MTPACPKTATLLHQRVQSPTGYPQLALLLHYSLVLHYQGLAQRRAEPISIHRQQTPIFPVRIEEDWSTLGAKSWSSMCYQYSLDRTAHLPHASAVQDWVARKRSSWCYFFVLRWTGWVLGWDHNLSRWRLLSASVFDSCSVAWLPPFTSPLW